MDAELTKDIRIIKDIRESSTNAAKVSAIHQARCESLDRTIARLEALAVDDGEITEPTIPPEFQVPAEKFWKEVAEVAKKELAAATARAEKAEAKYDQMVACAKKQKSDAVAWHAAYQAKCGELSAAQEREAKLREFCEASVWLYPYQVLKTLDKGGE